MIPSAVIAQGTGLVGDFNKATMRDSEQARVTFTEAATSAALATCTRPTESVFRGEEHIAAGVSARRHLLRHRALKKPVE